MGAIIGRGRYARETYPQASSGGSPGAVETTFVVDPTASTARNVFTTFALANAAARLVEGPVNYDFRTATTIPAGAYPLGKDPVTFSASGDTTALTIADGASFTGTYGLLTICGPLNVTFQGNTPAVTNTTNRRFVIDGSVCVATGTAAFSLTTASFTDVYMRTITALTGAKKFFDVTGGTLTLRTFDSSSIGEDTLAQSGGGTISVEAIDSSSVILDQAGVAGGRLITGTTIFFLSDKFIDPTEITGILGMYIGETYNPVTGTWTDVSGQGNHLTQALAAPQKPILGGGLNGHPTVAFVDADDSYLNLPAGLQRGTLAGESGKGATTVYFVVFGTVDGVSRGLLDPKTDGVFVYSNIAATNTWAVFGAAAYAYSGESLGTFKQICAAWDRTTATGPVDMYTAALPPISGTPGGVSVGADGILGGDQVPTTGHNLNGEVAFFAIFAGRHSPETVGKMRAYLRNRFPSIL